MYSLYEAEGIVMNETVDDKDQQFAMVGKEAYSTMGKEVPEQMVMEDNGTYYDTCGILADNQVKVSVSSQLGETRQARLNLLMELVKLGLPFKFLLEHLEFPNTSDILERIASESLAEMMMQSMGQSGGDGTQELSALDQSLGGSPSGQ